MLTNPHLQVPVLQSEFSAYIAESREAETSKAPSSPRKLIRSILSPRSRQKNRPSLVSGPLASPRSAKKKMLRVDTRGSGFEKVRTNKKAEAIRNRENLINRSPVGSPARGSPSRPGTVPRKALAILGSSPAASPIRKSITIARGNTDERSTYSPFWKDNAPNDETESLTPSEIAIADALSSPMKVMSPKEGRTPIVPRLNLRI